MFFFHEHHTNRRCSGTSDVTPVALNGEAKKIKGCVVQGLEVDFRVVLFNYFHYLDAHCVFADMCRGRCRGGGEHYITNA